MSSNSENSSRGAVSHSQDGEVSVSEVFRTLAEGWKALLSIFLFAIAFGLAYILGSTPKYPADALIQVEEKKGSSLGSLQQIATALDVAQSPTAGEIEIIRSRDILGKAIKNLHLDIVATANGRVPFFSDEYNREGDWKSTTVSEPRFGLTGLAWGGERLEADTFEVPVQLMERTFRLKVIEGGQWDLSLSNVLVAHGIPGEDIRFKAEGRDCVIRIKTVVARAGESFSLQKLSNVKAYQRLAQTLKVTEATKQSSIIKISAEGNDPYSAAALVNEIAKAYLQQNVSRRSEEAEKSLEFLNDQLPKLQTSVEQSETAFNNYRLSRQSIDLDKESEALLTKSVDLEKQRVELDLRRQEMEQRFQPNHPDMVALRAQLTDINSEENALSLQIKRLPTTEQEFFRLQRDVKVNTDLYTALLNNAQELRIARAGTIGNVRVIDFATPDLEPSKPQKTLVLGIAATLGLLGGVVIVLLVRSLHPTLRQADELSRLTSLPIYAVIPQSKHQESILPLTARRNRSREARLLFDVEPNDPSIEALRAMRLGLQFAIPDGGKAIVAITGPTQGLGKTFVVANLASILAATGKRVLLIDADMRRPRIQDCFGLDRSPGLSNFLAGADSFETVLRAGVRENIDIVTAGIPPPNPSELLSRPRLGEMLEQVSNAYDYVLLDTPPLLPVSDSLIFGRLASCTFMVVRAGASTGEDVQSALVRAANAGFDVKGLIFNGIQINRFSSRYGTYTYV